MEFKLLKAFVTVAHTKSFSKTSEILNYAQSSISEQIKKLEYELGTKLFERLGNTISLTKNGELFLPYAEKILNLYSEATQTLSYASSSVIKGTLTIAITETLCVFRFPKLFRNYRTLYPNVDINIKIGNWHDFPSWIRKNMVDIAFVLDSNTNYLNLVSETLFYEPLVLITSNNHNWNNGNKFNHHDLKNENLILTPNKGQYRTIFEKYLMSIKVEPKSILEFESIEAIKQFVINDFGISFLPRISVEKELSNGDLCEFSLSAKNISLPCQILYHNNKWISPALQALLDLTHNLF